MLLLMTYILMAPKAMVNLLVNADVPQVTYGTVAFVSPTISYW